MTKKLLAIILTLALLLSVVSVGFVIPAAAEEIEVWDGQTVSASLQGSGTQTDPYLISNGADLAYMYTSVQTGTDISRGKYYKLTSDIYLNDTTNDNWLTNNPNSWYTSQSGSGTAIRFQGYFDGAGHTVYGLYYNGASGYQGLLPVMVAWNNDIEVKNLTVSDSLIASTGTINGVVSSRVYSDNNKTAHFYNINITDSVTIMGATDGYVGGIVGFAQITDKSKYQFYGCSVRADVSTGHALIGYGTASALAKIEQCYTTSTDWYPTNSKQSDSTYIVSSADIKGSEAAKNTMPGLDFDKVFSCTETGYPTPVGYNVNNTVGQAWNGYIAAYYAGGTGTKADPYIIETAEQLAKLAADASTSGKYYLLTADIIVNDTSAENWTETAKQWLDYYQSGSFAGTLDGAFHTISGLYYTGANSVALFSKLGASDVTATINKVRIANTYFNAAGSGESAFGGYIFGAVTFNDCVVDKSVTLIGKNVGAYAGYNSGNVTINNCLALANITASVANCGGAFIGDVWTSTLKINNSIGIGAFSPRRTYSGSNNYGTVDNANGQVAVVTEDEMQGPDALTNMSSLTGYFATEGFPVRYNNGVKGEAWSGGIAKEYAGGNGSETNPYIIETAEQLARLVHDNFTAGKFYKLGADIKINDTSAANWTDTAKTWFDYAHLDEVKFRGTLDGALHTISGLYYNGTGYAALMPCVEGTVLVKNLYIKNSSVNNTGSDSNSHNAAAFISRADYSNTNITFDACFVDDTVTLTSAKSAAAFVGYGTANVTIKNSGAAAVVNAGRRPGAFISDFWGSGKLTISNSYAAGTKISGNITYTATNCYSSEESATGVSQVAAANMKGENAVINMPKLFCMGVTEGYPVYYQQGTKGKAWTGSIAYSYAGGAGTKANPYIIETAEQLVKLVADTNTSGKYYALAADIIVNDTSAETWTETAKQWLDYNQNGGFAGTLNGDFHTISGLYYTGANSVALFSKLGASGVTATINKVRIANTYFNATGNGESAFGGFILGAVNFNDCTVDKTVTIIGKNVGAYAGYNSGNVTINNCLALANVSGSVRTGAFVGDLWSCTVKINNSIGIGKFSPKTSFSGSNNYGTDSTGSDGVNLVTEDEMQGPDALTNMSLLTGYFATEGFPVRYYVGQKGEVWSGGIAKSFAAGDGTKNNPYIILTGEQLARMLNTASSNNNYKLGADIILSDETTKNNWLDSTNSQIFSGHFDGAGYVISGLNYENTVASGINVGLFPVTNGAWISSVILEDSNINLVTNAKADTYVGAIVGFVTGNRTTLYSCYVKEDVYVANTRGAEVTANNAVGGFIGGGDNGAVTIDGCAFFGNIAESGFDRYGALFGNIWNSSVANREVKNTIVNSVPSTKWGFIGEKNVTTEGCATNIEGYDTFTVVDTLQGEEGFAVIDSVANYNDRYIGTEGYPIPLAIAKRLGDVNFDKKYDQTDVTIIRNYILGNTKLGYTDVNRDGSKDIADLVSARIKMDAASAYESKGYNLVWSDEFDGSSLDSFKWSTQTRMSDTKELAQSNSGEVRSVADGNLTLTAKENRYYNENGTYFEQHKYMTTGSVSTEGKMSYQYGYLEIRAKVPYGAGLWPSFWLRSHNASGKQVNPKYEVEVDVFEVFGSTDTLASNLHQQNFSNGDSKMTGGKWWLFSSQINEDEKYTFENAENLNNEYHLYAFEWTPDTMTIYVDGVKNVEWKLNRTSLTLMGLDADATGFNTTMNVLFNNHLFTESSEYIPTNGTIEDNPGNLPADYDIDYVRLYQKNDGISKLIIE